MIRTKDDLLKTLITHSLKQVKKDILKYIDEEGLVKVSRIGQKFKISTPLAQFHTVGYSIKNPSLLELGLVDKKFNERKVIEGIRLTELGKEIITILK